ncbi:PIH1 domain-containing protein 2 [Lutzomyia longipalpis]|uniref:PIH1 domain-containing protein 2 n=1 Tax=Lutzomyia longipalpis TaxID=7200 RepID=UPI0024843678|nr:PIH1 domain-containing protein 2 [Lutzomyia longipalpis]
MTSPQSPQHGASKEAPARGRRGCETDGVNVEIPVTAGVTIQQKQQQFQMETAERPPNFRHSRAFRNFKNPPQPRMCIRDTTIDGEELFINVMSWSRIVMPSNPSDPIPLYGGMRVHSGNPRSPPLVFAVMANPDVLKETGRNMSTDDQERQALLELMCEFVEAMNPGLRLTRKPIVVKDRDLSGELKDIWGAVQAKRDIEREASFQEQIAAAGTSESNLVVYTELGPETAPTFRNNHKEADEATPQSAITKASDKPKSPEEDSPKIELTEAAHNELPLPQETPQNASIAPAKGTGSAGAKQEKKLTGFLPNGCHNFFSKRRDKAASGKEGKDKSKNRASIKKSGKESAESGKSLENEMASLDLNGISDQDREGVVIKDDTFTDISQSVKTATTAK